jgi:hypothetical protein
MLTMAPGSPDFSYRTGAAAPLLLHHRHQMLSTVTSHSIAASRSTSRENVVLLPLNPSTRQSRLPQKARATITRGGGSNRARAPQSHQNRTSHSPSLPTHVPQPFRNAALTEAGPIGRLKAAANASGYVDWCQHMFYWGETP